MLRDHYPRLLADDPNFAERAEALRALGLAGYERNRPSQLSGGQQQRVAIARALVNDPAILLADEPTGNLDSATSHELMQTLRTLNRERGLTIVLVTHEREMAAYADRIVTLRDVFEAITGEFRSGRAEDQWAVQRDDGSWLLDGLIPIPELKDRLDFGAAPEEELGRYNTLSGMVMPVSPVQ